MMNSTKFGTKTFRSVALTSALSATAVLGTLAAVNAQEAAQQPAQQGNQQTNQQAAQQPTQQESAALATVIDLASAMKSVGKTVEPSVVDIRVEKAATSAAAGGGLDDEMLKRFFPDKDGDGEPDVPEGFKERFGPGGPGGGEQVQRGEGSGVILDASADKAYILTNNHVAGGATKLLVTLSDGRKIEDVRVVGTDPRTDLAVLEIKGENLKASRWGDSDKLEKGDIVLAFGAPFGYVGSMTQGIVSGTNRQTAPRGFVGILGREGYESFIQTDCAINPGNSGGPLVNLRGEVVGINTAIASTTGSFNGIGFAVPSSLARSVYEQLRESGKVTRGYLGVRIQDTTTLDKRQVERLKLNGKDGVWVGGALNSGPAAGKLQPDDVIVTYNGQPVKTTQELRLRVAATKPETDVKLGVIRAGQEQTVDMKLGTAPEAEQVAAGATREPASPAPGEMGATLSNANAARLKAAGLPADAKGALVTAIKDGSPAQLAGLVVGDLITKVNDTDVTDAETASAAVKAAKLSDGISLLVMSKEGSKSVFVQVEQ